MPRRTNEKQEIIALLRRLLARPGCVVSESKMLKDQVTGLEREVDVVMECPESDITLTVSFEVLGHGRPADLEWVEQQQMKHRGLPTNTLVLVSWSGFTDGAVQAARRDPRLLLMKPELVFGSDGQASVRALYADELELRVSKVVLSVLRSTGAAVRVAAFPDNYLFDADAEQIGTARELAEAFVNSPDVFRKVGEAIHNDPERDKVVAFVVAHGAPAAVQRALAKGAGEPTAQNRRHRNSRRRFMEAA